MVANKSIIERAFDLIGAKVSIKERSNFLGGPRGIGNSAQAVINIKKNKFNIVVEKGAELQLGIVNVREKHLFITVRTKREVTIYICSYGRKKWVSDVVYNVSKKRKVYVLFGQTYEEEGFKRFQRAHPERAKHARVEYI